MISLVVSDRWSRPGAGFIAKEVAVVIRHTMPTEVVDFVTSSQGRIAPVVIHFSGERLVYLRESTKYPQA